MYYSPNGVAGYSVWKSGSVRFFDHMSRNRNRNRLPLLTHMSKTGPSGLQPVEPVLIGSVAVQ